MPFAPPVSPIGVKSQIRPVSFFYFTVWPAAGTVGSACRRYWCFDAHQPPLKHSGRVREKAAFSRGASATLHIVLQACFFMFCSRGALFALIGVSAQRCHAWDPSYNKLRNETLGQKAAKFAQCVLGSIPTRRALRCWKRCSALLRVRHYYLFTLYSSICIFCVFGNDQTPSFSKQTVRRTLHRLLPTAYPTDASLHCER